MASVGWIDFSQKDRNRVGTILDLITPEGQVDELGIGTIRDALADEIFPGISTIQTRAKYFFIIPYILQDYLRLSPEDRSRQTPANYLDQQEHEIMWQLSDIYQKQLNFGVIGITKNRGERIVRRPSEIYWNGLNVFRCINSLGLSINGFLNNANAYNLESLIQRVVEDDGQDDPDASFNNFFNIKVPLNIKWKENLSMDLTKDEAEFLRDSILDIQNVRLKNSLLPLVIENTEVYEVFRTCHHFADFVKIIINEELNFELKRKLILAHDFSIIIEGAHIAYNKELQSHFYKQDTFSEDWEEWYNNFRTSMIDFNNFNPEDLFIIASTTRDNTANFIRGWWNLLKESELNIEEKSRLIRAQESSAKGRKARLKWNNRDSVKEGKRIGLHQLEYRFPDAQVIVNDIIKGHL